MRALPAALLALLGGAPFGSTAPPPEVPQLAVQAANFRGLVLGCIEAKFCKKICV